MSIYDWFLIAWFLYGAVVVVNSVGKARPVITPAAAAVAVVIQSIWIAGLCLSRGAL